MAATTSNFFFLTVVFLVHMIGITTGEGIDFPWCIPQTPYDSQMAKVGDTIAFTWDGVYHNVYMYPSGTCTDKTDREYLGEASGASYTFTSDDIGTNKTFVCDVGGHCASGQIVTFANIASSDAEDVTYSTSNPCGDDHDHSSHNHEDDSDSDSDSDSVPSSGKTTSFGSAAAFFSLIGMFFFTVN